MKNCLKIMINRRLFILACYYKYSRKSRLLRKLESKKITILMKFLNNGFTITKISIMILKLGNG